MSKKKVSTSRTPAKTIGMIVMGIASVVYLLNPTWGLFELLPDNLPGVGNIDEALAALLLFRVLTYFGINVGGTKPEGKVVDIDGPGDKR